jgi:hypothetical protein
MAWWRRITSCKCKHGPYAVLLLLAVHQEDHPDHSPPVISFLIFKFSCMISSPFPLLSLSLLFPRPLPLLAVTGVTVLFTALKMDSGPILSQVAPTLGQCHWHPPNLSAYTFLQCPDSDQESVTMSQSLAQQARGHTSFAFKH